MSRLRKSYDVAYAIGRDAGNRSMRQNGRTSWNDEDYDAALQAFEAAAPQEETLEERTAQA